MVLGGLVAAGLLVWALSRSLNAPTRVTPPAVTDTVAPTTSAPEQAEDRASVHRITPEELKQKFDRGEVTIIDVRDADAYLAGHIPGALQIPFSRIEGEIPFLPKAKQIVFYCT